MWASLISQKDSVHFFKDNTFTFTGKLNLMDRADAFSLVKLCGGECSKNLTKRTNVLIVGSYHNNECCRNKYRTAVKYNEQGQNIQIISEEVFYQMLLWYFSVRVNEST